VDIVDRILKRIQEVSGEVAGQVADGVPLDTYPGLVGERRGLLRAERIIREEIRKERGRDRS
jgi:hypothetical protein